MRNIFELPSLKYMSAVPDPKTSEMIETEKEVNNLQIFKLQRTNLAHSKFAFGLNRNGDMDMDAIMDDAVKYAKLCIVDPKLREEISKDAFACLTIFQSEEVQKDIADFFIIISRQMGISGSEEKTIQE